MKTLIEIVNKTTEIICDYIQDIRYIVDEISMDQETKDYYNNKIKELQEFNNYITDNYTLVDYEKLANFLLDYLCESNGVRETIKTLYDSGYQKYKLEFLKFDKKDIEASKDIKW